MRSCSECVVHGEQKAHPRYNRECVQRSDRVKNIFINIYVILTIFLAPALGPARSWNYEKSS